MRSRRAVISESVIGNQRISNNGARLCPKDQPQRVAMEKRVGWFQNAAALNALRLVLRTQPRSTDSLITDLLLPRPSHFASLAVGFVEEDRGGVADIK